MKHLITSLIGKGIRLSDEKGQLKVHLGSAQLNDEEKARIGELKMELLQYLDGRKASLLSFAQERMWFLAELGFSQQYHISNVKRLAGKLDLHAFRKAFRKLFPSSS